MENRETPLNKVRRTDRKIWSQNHTNPIPSYARNMSRNSSVCISSLPVLSHRHNQNKQVWSYFNHQQDDPAWSAGIWFDEKLPPLKPNGRWITFKSETLFQGALSQHFQDLGSPQGCQIWLGLFAKKGPKPNTPLNLKLETPWSTIYQNRSGGSWEGKGLAAKEKKEIILNLGSQMCRPKGAF